MLPGDVRMVFADPPRALAKDAARFHGAHHPRDFGMTLAPHRPHFRKLPCCPTTSPTLAAEPQEVSWWVDALSVTEEELRVAVAEVGVEAKDVRIMLGKA